MRVMRSVALGAVVTFAGGSDILGAQPRAIHGVVMDSAGRGLEGVEVQLRGVERSITTGPSGEFQFDRVSGSQFWLVARRPGFRSVQSASRFQRHERRELRLRLVPQATAAPVAAGSFHERVRDHVWRSRAAARGWVLTGQDLARRNVTTLDDVWPDDVGRLSGSSGVAGVGDSNVSGPMWYPPPTAIDQGSYKPPVSMPSSPNSPEPTPAYLPVPGSQSPARFAHAATPVRCSPAVSVNGGDVTDNLSLADIPVAAVQSVELYSGIGSPTSDSDESPGNVGASCGVVVVWLKA